MNILFLSQSAQDVRGTACHTLPGLTSTRGLRSIDAAGSDVVCVCTGHQALRLTDEALERMSSVLMQTGAGMVYSDRRVMRGGRVEPHPVIDYQPGSLRDDFDFGPLVAYSAKAFAEAVAAMDADYRFAALYDLRLRVSRRHAIVHLPECLYTQTDSDTRLSGQKQFDYVNPRNADVQKEMEAACTAHLKAVGAWLPQLNVAEDLDAEPFDAEASVIIPVRDRCRSIADAIASALGQQADFRFNVIVVDNHSTDGTTDIVARMAAADPRVVHIRPERTDLGIGGCWNAAVADSRCGRFAVQLDSDDLYIATDVLSRIVAAFRTRRCAMIVGSYKLVDFDLRDLPPGIISHSEWTDANGHNNALRINGLGAPRAFFTPVLRRLPMPNVSYGEDYAAGLAVGRAHTIGRIFEPLYLCRRWEGNSDANLDTERVNRNNLFKDRLRTIEIMARRHVNDR